MKHSVNHNHIVIEVISSLRTGLSAKQFITWCQYLAKGLDSYLKNGDLLPKSLQQLIATKGITFSLTLCADGKMQSLNRHYRNKNKTTDVLSFPLHQDLYLIRSKILFPVDHLGDIFISYPVMVKQAKSFALSAEEEFYHLAAHGLLHLLGVDHERSKNEDLFMRQEEQKIIKQISKVKKSKRK